MWSLIFENNNKKLPLLVDQVYTIGRKDADITIADDSSISRKHGFIKVLSNNNCFKVTITDSSKFGTYFSRNGSNTNSEKDFVKVDGSADLADGDIIRIGVQHTQLKLVKDQLLVVTSMMKEVMQNKLYAAVPQLGGKIVNVWQEGVTHLVMNRIILNVKVTQALATGCYIVTDAFFTELLDSICKHKKRPNEENFLPLLSEDGLNVNVNTFLPDNCRNHIFDNQVFVFFSAKQLKRLGHTCCASGAAVKLISEFSENDLNNLTDSFSKYRFLVENVPDYSLVSEDFFSDLQLKLVEQNLRFVQEHEIGLALVYSSADVYTNPEFDLTLDNTYTQPMVPGESMSQAKPSQSIPDTVVLESQENVSHDPKTDLVCDAFEEMPETSLKKRMHSTMKSSDDSLLLDETPSKFIKSESVVEKNDNYFLNFSSTSSKRKAKPPPKRKLHSSIRSKNSPESKRACNDILKPNNSSVQSAESLEFVKEEASNSCFSDNSLWANNAEYQENNDSDQTKKDALNSEATSKINTNEIIEANSYKNTEEKLIPRKAFVPASVPEDDENNFMSKLDPDLPFAGLAIIHEVPLRKSKSSTRLSSNFVKNPTSKTKNFKKFVKIHPTYKNFGSQTSIKSTEPPRIIGGKDLVKHSNRIEYISVYKEFLNEASDHDFQGSNKLDIKGF